MGSQSSITASISEMTCSVAVEIMKRADLNKNGYVTELNLVSWAESDPVGFELIEDLFNFAPDFIEKHRFVVN